MDKLETIESLVYQLESLKNHPEGYIYDYFEKIKNEVDLRREMLKQEIDKCSDQMIEKIERTRHECTRTSSQLDDVSTEADIYMQDLNNLKEKFNSLDTNCSKVDILQRELVRLECQLNVRIKKQKNLLTQNKMYSFEFDSEDFEDYNIEDHFGQIEEKNIGEYYYTNKLECSAPDVTRALAFNNSNLLATAGDEGFIQIWNTATWKLVKDLSMNVKESLTCVAFSPNNLLASGSTNGLVHIWNTDKWNSVKKLDGHSALVFSVAFNKNKFMASASRDMTVLLWNTETWDLVKELKELKDIALSVAFSQSNLLACGFGLGKVRVWNTETVKELEGHKKGVYSVAFSKDGLFLATGSCDKMIRVWNTESWDLVRELEGHTGTVDCVAFDCGNCLATGSSDGTVRVWSTETWDLVQKISDFQLGKKEVSAVAFGKNNLMAVAFQDEPVRIWKQETGPLN